MKPSIMTTPILLAFGFLITVPAFTQENGLCGSDFYSSQIENIAVNDNAKYVSNEIEIEIDRPIDDVFKWVVYTPLEVQLRGTKKIPGVRSTKALNNIALGTVGYRRLVCLEDGNTAVEEVLTHLRDEYYAYKVWNYTLKVAQKIKYAKGEWWFTPLDNKTHIRWRYSFKLDNEKLIGKMGCCGRWLFKSFFIKTQYHDWMVETLKRLKKDMEIKTL